MWPIAEYRSGRNYAYEELNPIIRTLSFPSIPVPLFSSPSAMQFSRLDDMAILALVCCFRRAV
jgi:hypothetical protein